MRELVQTGEGLYLSLFNYYEQLIVCTSYIGPKAWVLKKTCLDEIGTISLPCLFCGSLFKHCIESLFRTWYGLQLPHPLKWTSLTSCGNKGESSGMLNILFSFDVVLFRRTPVNSNLVDSSSPLLTRLTPSQLLASSWSRAVFKVSEVSLNVVMQWPNEQQSQPNQPEKS